MNCTNASTRAVSVPVAGTEIMLQRWLSVIGPSAAHTSTDEPSNLVTQPPEGWLDLTQYSFDSLNIGIHISLVNNGLAGGVTAGDFNGSLEVLSGYCLGQPDAAAVSLAKLGFRLTAAASGAVTTLSNLSQAQPIAKSNPSLGRYLFWRLNNIGTQVKATAGNETLVCFEIKLQLIGG
jgi:hypothetical protein